MSSHHFVKEKQEPSIILSSAEDFDDEIVGQLLEWSPTLIVPDFLAGFVLSKGLKVDVVLQITFLEHDLDTLLFAQSAVRILKIADAEKWLEELIALLFLEKNYVLTIIGSNLSATQRLFIKKIQIVIYSKLYKQFAIPTVFTKWYKKGTLLEVELDDIPNILEMKNIKMLPSFSFEVLADDIIFIKSMRTIIIREFL